MALGLCQFVLQLVSLFSFLPRRNALSLSPPHLLGGLSHFAFQRFDLVTVRLQLHFGSPTGLEGLGAGATCRGRPGFLPDASRFESTPFHSRAASLFAHNYNGFCAKELVKQLKT